MSGVKNHQTLGSYLKGGYRPRAGGPPASHYGGWQKFEPTKEQALSYLRAARDAISRQAVGGDAVGGDVLGSDMLGGGALGGAAVGGGTLEGDALGGDALGGSALGGGTPCGVQVRWQVGDS